MRRKKINFLILSVLCSLCLILAACQPSVSESDLPDATEVSEEPTEVVPVEEPEEVPDGEDETPEQPLIEPNPLAADPIPQTFQASDGVELEGFFYPAETTNAPVVVLMHWAIGDQKDWDAIAPWLQNRGYQANLSAGGEPWLDPDWFPEMLEGLSLNVFTFTFRNCSGGCASMDREGWLLDLEAAMAHLTSLDGVDLSRVMTVGASIGADGAALGCHYFNTEIGGECQGAFSLSPGGYLTIPYPEEVDSLEGEQPAKPAWCLFSQEDVPAVAACENAEGELYQDTGYEGFAHGMSLIDPLYDPNPLDLILAFIESYLMI